jgi:hypothetical protein
MHTEWTFFARKHCPVLISSGVTCMITSMLGILPDFVISLKLKPIRHGAPPIQAPCFQGDCNFNSQLPHVAANLASIVITQNLAHHFLQRMSIVSVKLRLLKFDES